MRGMGGSQYQNEVTNGRKAQGLGFIHFKTSLRAHFSPVRYRLVFDVELPG